MEEEDWKPFSDALDKPDRKRSFVEKFNIPGFFISTCS
jgi:hypothetical protein